MFAVPDYTVLAPSIQHSLAQPGIAALVRSVAVHAQRWPQLLRFDQGRPAHAVLPTDGGGHQVWLSGWLPGQQAAEHAHCPLVQGAFAVVSGLIVERSRGSWRTLRPGQTRVFGPGYRHSLRNVGVEPAVTVHVELRGAAPARDHEAVVVS